MKKVILSVFLVLATALTLSAQSLTPLTWKQHGVTFKVPAGADILRQSGEVFEVDDANFNVKLEIIKGTGITAEEIGSALVIMAEQEGMLNVGDAELQTFENKGCWGISIEGDRSGDAQCCAFIVSVNSDLVVYVSVTYAHGLESKANDIINSVVMTK